MPFNYLIMEHSLGNRCHQCMNCYLLLFFLRLQDTAKATSSPSTETLTTFCCSLTLTLAVPQIIDLATEMSQVDFQHCHTQKINLLICYSGYLQQSCVVIAKILDSKLRYQYSSFLVKISFSFAENLLLSCSHSCSSTQQCLIRNLMLKIYDTIKIIIIIFYLPFLKRNHTVWRP